MRKLIALMLSGVGLLLVLMAFTILAQGNTASVLAQDEDDEEAVEAEEDAEIEISDFAGTRECRDCHRDLASAHSNTAHARTLVEIEDDAEPEDNPIRADFSVGEDIRTVFFPDDDERAFTEADVAFTLGAGRHMQAFLYALDEDVYQVLPAQWDVMAQAWSNWTWATTGLTPKARMPSVRSARRAIRSA